MGEKVSYEYSIDDKVKTPFGAVGIVTMLGFDDGGKCYHVKTEKSANWFKEKELSKS